jgi:sodium-dependent dicarboxylate transporter 2/3/5
MSQAVKCLILLAVVALLFVTELIPLAITATAGAIACGLLGFIPAKQVFSGLSNSTVVCRYVHRWRSNVLYRFGPKNR